MPAGLYNARFKLIKEFNHSGNGTKPINNDGPEYLHNIFSMWYCTLRLPDLRKALNHQAKHAGSGRVQQMLF